MHQGKRRDQRAPADPRVRHDNGIRAHKRVFAQDHTSHDPPDVVMTIRLEVAVAIETQGKMGAVREHSHPRPDLTAVPQLDAVPAVEDRIMPDEDVTAELQAFPIRDVGGVAQAQPPAVDPQLQHVGAVETVPLPVQDTSHSPQRLFRKHPLCDSLH